MIVLLALSTAAAAAANVRTAQARAGRPSARAAGSLSGQAIAAKPSWRRYVLDPRHPVVYPKAVAVRGGGSVEHPDGLLAGHSPTTIRSIGGGDPTLILDLGQDVGGRVEVGISRTDGAPVRLAYAEARRYLGPDGDMTGGSLGSDDNPDGRTDEIDATRPLRFVSPGIRGAERWISVRLEGPGTVTLSYVRVRYTSYRPAPTDYAGHFLSSARLLNRIWYATAYTFDLDSISGGPAGSGRVVVDGAKRDRLVWLGDLALEALTGAYSTASAPAIVSRSVDLFPCKQAADGYIAPLSQPEAVCPSQPSASEPVARTAVLPEYTAWWIVAAAESLQYGGDRSQARALLPTMRRALVYLGAHIGPDGLFHTEGSPTLLNWHPFDTARGADAHTNATWVLALHDAAKVERWVGDPARARADQSRAQSIREAMLKRLWEPRAGAFRVNTADPVADRPQDGIVEAILAGVLNRGQAKRALRYIGTRLETRLGPLTTALRGDPFMSRYISPYISSWELLARFSEHDAAGALSLMRRLFGHMVTRDPASTMWEKVAPDGAPATTPNTSGPGATSLAHGWGTGAVPALSGYVLGLRPASPGWARWIVAPQAGGLRFAQGQVETPRGRLVSRWVHGDGSFRVTVIAPRGTTGHVAVPLLGRDRTIARDGHLVWPQGGAGGPTAVWRRGTVVLSQRGGTHTYAWSRVPRRRSRTP